MLPLDKNFLFSHICSTMTAQDLALDICKKFLMFYLCGIKVFAFQFELGVCIIWKKLKIQSKPKFFDLDFNKFGLVQFSFWRLKKISVIISVCNFLSKPNRNIQNFY